MHHLHVKSWFRFSSDTCKHSIISFTDQATSVELKIRDVKGIMVSSAIFGAAAGTGLALVVAMTIVVYRYYAMKRKGKCNWNNLDRWPDPPSSIRNNNDEYQPRHYHHCHTATTSHVLDCWRKPQKSYYAVQTVVSIIRHSFATWLVIRNSHSSKILFLWEILNFARRILSCFIITRREIVRKLLRMEENYAKCF